MAAVSPFSLFEEGKSPLLTTLWHFPPSGLHFNGLPFKKQAFFRVSFEKNKKNRPGKSPDQEGKRVLCRRGAEGRGKLFPNGSGPDGQPGSGPKKCKKGA
jgi:hypothetical protein